MRIGTPLKLARRPLESSLARKVGNGTITILILKLGIGRGFWEKVENTFKPALKPR